MQPHVVKDRTQLQGRFSVFWGVILGEGCTVAMPSGSAVNTLSTTKVAAPFRLLNGVQEGGQLGTQTGGAPGCAGLQVVPEDGQQTMSLPGTIFVPHSPKTLS